MSLPRADYDPRRVFLLPNPFSFLPASIVPNKHSFGVYSAGLLFAIANWLFLDAVVLSAHAKAPWGGDGQEVEVPVHVTFSDWLPGISSFIGFLIVNLIDKDRVSGSDAYGDSRAVWRARLFLFIGFAFIAGGLAGSVCVLVLKYVLPDHPAQFTYYGYANVGQNAAMMASAVVLWYAQSQGGEYEYNLTL